MTFLGWLLSLLAKLGLDFWTHRGPSAIVVEAEKAGGAQAQVQIMEATNVEADKATAAQDAAVAAVRTDAGLRKFEQTDPNNRANDSGS